MYTPFKKMEAELADTPGVRNPAGLTASLAARKYGTKALQNAARSHTSLRNAKPVKHRPARRKALTQFARQHGGH